jgi:hypothetical protein
MRAKIFFITLAVDDLGRSVAFYWDGLGWPTEGIIGQEFHDEATTGAGGTIAFFILDGSDARPVRARQPSQGCQPARPARPSSA